MGRQMIPKVMSKSSRYDQHVFPNQSRIRQNCAKEHSEHNLGNRSLRKCLVVALIVQLLTPMWGYWVPFGEPFVAQLGARGMPKSSFLVARCFQIVEKIIPGRDRFLDAILIEKCEV